jgi:thioredoxin reductase (NADPH)
MGISEQHGALTVLRSEGKNVASVAIIGDGPGGLSAALFLGKNGHDTVVYGTDQTAMHFAFLYNYLGIPEIDGSEFQRIARAQVASFGVAIVDDAVTAVADGDRFSVVTGAGSRTFDYLIFAEGKNPTLARSFGLDVDDAGAIVVDREYASSMAGVYAIGRSARPERSQAIISAGAGATAALDIMAREAGKNVTDWDTPPDA